MEPFKIQIEVKLSDDTLDAIKRIVAATIFSHLGKDDQDTVTEMISEKEKEEPKQETPAEERKPEEIGDMPDFSEPEKAREVSDDELAAKTRETVTALKARHVNPTVVRTQVFAKYGISQSTECPKDKREAFLADLDQLAKEE